MSRAGGPVSSGDTAVAFVVAHARYWLTVAPKVKGELRRWYEHAEAIADPTLRRHAAEKLRYERANTEAIATLCTLAPRQHRDTVVVAAVALQVMYDYLDAVTEQDVERPLRNSRQLFRTFSVVLTPGEAPVDYYRYHPQCDDNGYLDALVASAREALGDLPALPAILPAARNAASQFTEAQTRSHAVPREGVDQLERWAQDFAHETNLSWWEWAAGASASILVVHALISAAADNSTTTANATRIAQAYLLGSTLTTMLDSLVDDERDSLSQGHRYIAYYPAPRIAGRRITVIAHRAIAAARELPHAAHHVMTVAGIAAFYLSLPRARSGVARAISPSIIRALEPTVLPAFVALRLWRRFVQGAGLTVPPPRRSDPRS
jgi:tetraprenyl-beta-curcumene synthase